MLADDRPSHSMTCHTRFWFSGKFDQTDFNEALRETLPRHPIFQMTVSGSVKNKTKDIFWVPRSEIVMPFISWAPEGTPIDIPANGLAQNIYKEIGLRFWIRDSDTPSPTQTMIILQFHHSVCDGLGVFQFMEDLLIAYGKKRGLATPPMRRIDPDAFTRRGEFSISPEDWRKRKPMDLKRVTRFIRKSAAPLKSPDSNKRLDIVADLFASERIVLPVDVTASVRANARAQNVAVNDTLIHDLFKTLSRWNADNGAANSHIRIGIATSLRGEHDTALSVANVVSMVFLDRTPREIQSPDLLTGVAAETTEIKDNRMGLALPRVFRRLGRYPYMVSLFFAPAKCSATAILTNLGRPFADSKLTGSDGKLRVGDITLESVETLPPVRPKTSAIFSVNYYGGSLSVTLRYDSTVFTRDTARNLLERFTTQIQSQL